MMTDHLTHPDQGRPPSRPTLLAALATLLFASPAMAHDGEGGGFVSGVLHPIGGLDHVLAMVAVGIWGAQLGRPQIWLLPITFPLVMALGGAAGLMGLPLPGVEIGIAASAVALGLMVLFEAKPPIWASLALVAFFAIFHGYAHGAELPEGQSGALYSLGFVISTGLLHALGIGIGVIHRWPVGQASLRASGVAVALGGLFFLAASFGWVG